MMHHGLMMREMYNIPCLQTNTISSASIQASHGAGRDLELPVGNVSLISSGTT